MNVFLRLILLTVPLFTGFSIVLGLMFGAMFEAEYEHSFYEKWKVTIVSIHASRMEGEELKRTGDLLNSLGKKSEIRSFVILNARKNVVYEWKKSGEGFHGNIKKIIESGTLFNGRTLFQDDLGYVSHTAKNGTLYVLAATDSDRSYFLSGYYRIFFLTVLTALALGIIIPLIFTIILNSQIRRIDGTDQHFSIQELDDLNHTFRIMKESLYDLRIRNAGMLRSGKTPGKKV